MSTTIVFLIIGDIVGKSGRKAVARRLPELREEYKADFVVANGENAAGGCGITLDLAKELFGYEIDVITMGNHVWAKREFTQQIDLEPRILRPLNLPPKAPGKGVLLSRLQGKEVAVITLVGRVYMDLCDCPFQAMAGALEELSDQTRIILVEMHAEATSEKEAMGHYLDGRVSAVFGTHTHVATADERILPGGTAYITDIGMTGPVDSILGIKKDLIIRRFIDQMPVKFEVAGGLSHLNGLVLEVDAETGKALRIERVRRLFDPAVD